MIRALRCCVFALQASVLRNNQARTPLHEATAAGGVGVAPLRAMLTIPGAHQQLLDADRKVYRCCCVCRSMTTLRLLLPLIVCCFSRAGLHATSAVLRPDDQHVAASQLLRAAAHSAAPHSRGL